VIADGFIVILGYQYARYLVFLEETGEFRRHAKKITVISIVTILQINDTSLTKPYCAANKICACPAHRLPRRQSKNRYIIVLAKTVWRDGHHHLHDMKYDPSGVCAKLLSRAICWRFLIVMTGSTG
jgi:hypothetical protein